MARLQQWNTNRFGVNTYNFDYDGANRISEAEFTGTGSHNTSYSYDKNGNITSLSREGRYGESSQYGGIDYLSYTYQGNQLQSVHDLNGNNTESEYYQNNGFTDNGSFATTEFTYDAAKLSRSFGIVFMVFRASTKNYENHRFSIFRDGHMVVKIKNNSQSFIIRGSTSAGLSCFFHKNSLQFLAVFIRFVGGQLSPIYPVWLRNKPICASCSLKDYPN